MYISVVVLPPGSDVSDAGCVRPLPAHDVPAGRGTRLYRPRGQDPNTSPLSLLLTDFDDNGMLLFSFAYTF